MQGVPKTSDQRELASVLTCTFDRIVYAPSLWFKQNQRNLKSRNLFRPASTIQQLSFDLQRVTTCRGKYF